MDLALTDDQRAILSAVDALVRPFEAAPLHDAPLAATSDGLDAQLRQNGFLDVARDPDLGTVTAAVVIERIARLPFATEAAFSAMIGPLLDEAPGPICLIASRRMPQLVRFLAPGTTVAIVGEQEVESFVATQDHLRAETGALYGYPMASLVALPDERQVHDIAPSIMFTHWRAALAAEAAGLLAAALASTVAHVSEREQFGRKLATFQALRHRLAEAQVRANGVYWLAMKAAGTLDPGDAALAAWHAQESARACIYDFHQFLGAMGMTLEHPLHMWTYRLKALIGELGGRASNAAAAADALWGRSNS